MPNYFKRKVFDARDKNVANVFKDKEQAQKEIEAMRSFVQKIVKYETSKNGLIVLQARYGNLETTREELVMAADEERDLAIMPFVNVTDALQVHVKESSLTLPAYPKYILNGFYDPCPEEEKQLYICYKMGDGVYEIECNDDEELVIPSDKARKIQ